MPRFSVLLPTYQSERYVANAIESALAQTVADVEVVVVDDGSSDGTAEIAGSYGPHVRLIRQENAGVAAARNRGLAEAAGEVVVLLDHDDELDARFLERVAPELEGGAGVAATDAYLYDEPRRALLPHTFLELWPLPPRADLVHLLRSNWVPPRAAVRTELARALGGFEEELSGVDEYHLWLKVLAAGERIAVAPEPLAYYRLRPGSQGTDRLATAELTARALKRALAELPLRPAEESECRVRIAGWHERAHLARAGRAVERRAWREAAAELVAARRVSPLRWRGLRAAGVAVEGLLRRRAAVEQPVAAVPVAAPMRELEPPRRRGGGTLWRAARAGRRALVTEASARPHAHA